MILINNKKNNSGFVKNLNKNNGIYIQERLVIKYYPRRAHYRELQSGRITYVRFTIVRRVKIIYIPIKIKKLKEVA